MSKGEKFRPPFVLRAEKFCVKNAIIAEPLHEAIVIVKIYKNSAKTHFFQIYRVAARYISYMLRQRVNEKRDSVLRSLSDPAYRPLSAKISDPRPHI